MDPIDVEDLQDTDGVLVIHVMSSIDEDGAPTECWRMTGKELKELVKSDFAILKDSESDDEEVQLEHNESMEEWRDKIEKQEKSCQYVCVLNAYYGSYVRFKIENLQKL